MAVDDKSMYLDQTDEKYGPLFNSGHVAMMISGPWSLLDIDEAKLDYGVTALPGLNGDHQTVSGPDLWVLFDHQDANRAAGLRLHQVADQPRRTCAGTSRSATCRCARPRRTPRSSRRYVKEYPGGQKSLRQPGQREAGPADRRRLRGDVPGVGDGDRQGAAG